MNNDPYAAPQANLDTDQAAIETSIWNARGRLSVLSYFAQSILFTIIIAALIALLAAIASVVTGGGFNQLMSSLESGEGGPGGLIIGIVTIPLVLVMMYVGVCFLIKRLHDRNHTGWWSLLMLIPLINLLFSLYVLLAPGNKGSNRFGGRRITRGWEKVLGIIGLVLYAGSIILAVVGTVAGLGA